MVIRCSAILPRIYGQASEPISRQPDRRVGAAEYCVWPVGSSAQIICFCALLAAWQKPPSGAAGPRTPACRCPGGAWWSPPTSRSTTGRTPPRRSIRVLDVSGASPRVLGRVPIRPASAGCHCGSARTTCTRTSPAPASASGSCSRRTSAPGSGSTTWPTRAPRRGGALDPEPPPGQPVPQINDLFVDSNGLVWVTDRITGGLYLLEPEPPLAALMAEARN
jgi:hypothetical protein